MCVCTVYTKRAMNIYKGYITICILYVWKKKITVHLSLVAIGHLNKISTVHYFFFPFSIYFTLPTPLPPPLLFGSPAAVSPIQRAPSAQIIIIIIIRRRRRRQFTGLAFIYYFFIIIFFSSRSPLEWYPPDPSTDSAA